MRRAMFRLLLAVAVAACSASVAETNRDTADPSGSHAMRERPTERGMSRAVERVLADARQCLRDGDPSVMVAGEFDGARGTFRVTRIAASTGGPLASAIDTCVRAVSERAHVRPFRVSNAAYAFSIQAPPSGLGSGSPASSTSSGGSSTSGSGSPNGPGATPSGRPSPASLVRAAGETYQRCYEQALERDHRVEGSVTVRMVLDREGQISRLACDVDTDHPDPTLMQIVSRCVEAHVRTIQFGPQYDPGHEVVVPLAFNPGGIRR